MIPFMGSPFLIAEQVQLLKLERLGLERSLLKARAGQHQHRCRLLALPYAAGTNFINFFRFFIHKAPSFSDGVSLLQDGPCCNHSD